MRVNAFTVNKALRMMRATAAKGRTADMAHGRHGARETTIAHAGGAGYDVGYGHNASKGKVIDYEHID